MRTNRNRIRLAVAVAALAGLAPGLPGAARAQPRSGIQLSPESNRYFISKDIGPERWAITYDLEDKTVSGNVFPLDGGDPTFLTCRVTRVEQAVEPADAMYSLECRAAGPCSTAPCVDQWGEPFPAGPIPGWFLLPPNTRATLAGNVQPIYDVSCATSAVCHGNGANFVVLAAGVSWANTVGVESDGVNGRQGPFVAPFDESRSFLLQKVLGTGAGDSMPYNGSPLPPEQIEVLRSWIREGAANN